MSASLVPISDDALEACVTNERREAVERAFEAARQARTADQRRRRLAALELLLWETADDAARTAYGLGFTIGAGLRRAARRER